MSGAIFQMSASKFHIPCFRFRVSYIIFQIAELDLIWIWRWLWVWLGFAFGCGVGVVLDFDSGFGFVFGLDVV